MQSLADSTWGEYSNENRLHVAEKLSDENHFVACIRNPSGRGDGADSVFDSQSDATLTFAAISLSVRKLEKQDRSQLPPR